MEDELKSLTSNEVISFLYNKSSIEKCRIGLADIVVFDNGKPSRWFVTGKTGEVTKKRNAELSIISQRWLKIFSQYKSPIVSICRLQGGNLKFISLEAWKDFVTDTTADPSIASLHCFIKGENNVVYRNNYKLKDKLGRFASSTQSYSLNLDPDNGSYPFMLESEMDMVESKATQIRNILDLATSTVVRYLEMTQSIRVLSISIDYVVDTKSQIWVMWTSPAKYIPSNKLESAVIADLTVNPDKTGRVGWVGPRYFEGLEDRAFDQQHLAASQRNDSANPLGSSKKVIRSTSPMKFSSSTPAKGLVFPVSDYSKLSEIDDEVVDSKLSLSQLHGASDILGRRTPSRGKNATLQSSSLTSSKYSLASTDPETSPVKQFSRSASSILLHSSAPADFPQPFKCVGDYCKLHISSKYQNSDMNRTGDYHTKVKLFTEKELIQLRKDKRFSQMMEFEQPGPALAAITNKSIIQAREEKRNLAASRELDRLLHSNDFSYPLTPRIKIDFLHEEQQESNKNGKKNGLDDFNKQSGKIASKEKEKEIVMTKDKEHREKFTKSMANYYEQVRVCGVCHSVYTTLDWARDVIGLNDAHGAGLEGSGAAFPKPMNHSTSLLGSSSVASFAAPTTASRANDLVVEEMHRKRESSSSPQRRAVESRNVDSYISRSGKQKSSSKQTKTWKDFLESTNPKSPPKGNSKTHSGQIQPNQKRSVRMEGESKQFLELDDYLRGGSEVLAARKLKEKDKLTHTQMHELVGLSSSHILPTGGFDNSFFENELKRSGSRDSTSQWDGVYQGKVLLACENESHAETIIDVLESAHFKVHWVRDGRQAVNDLILMAPKPNGLIDCVLVHRHLPLGDAFEVTNNIRDYEKSMRKKASSEAAAIGSLATRPTRRHPVICVADETAPEDLRKYINSDMDGCVSLPISNPISLLNTVRAAVPHHLAILNPQQKPSISSILEGQNAAELAEQSSASRSTKVYKLGALGQLEGSLDSSTMAAKSLPAGTSNQGSSETDVGFNGVVQIDADTRLPFMVLDASKTTKLAIDPNKRPFFNLVVCHDLFDTCERMKIFLRPIVQKYLGLQVLLWNYPGQAFTEWREEQLLNNEYLATCLNEVLGQLGEKGTKDFDTTKPFYILGYGNGASIASFYASHYQVNNLRGIISVNGWTYLDSYLAGVMHDCINIFQCSPPSRPDLPVYFFSRFLFSKDYLAKVSVPLALNIYTAVHNSISLKGRINLCKGVLQLVDVRKLLREIDCPIICIQSTQDSLARPLHVEPFVVHRAGEVKSIFKVLRDPTRTCVVWMKGGHEIFQENKKQSQLLIEQILTGFHESHDVSFPSSQAVDAASVNQGRLVSNLPWENKSDQKTVEDKFIDNVLGSMKKLNPAATSTGNFTSLSNSQMNPQQTSANLNTSPNRPSSRGTTEHSQHRTPQLSNTDPAAWHEFSKLVAEGQISGSVGQQQNMKKSGVTTDLHGNPVMNRIVDPTSSLFEKQDSAVYGAKMLESKLQNVAEYPEVKEYMNWRLKKNKKRLQRLQAASRIIQACFRAYIARKFVNGMRRKKAAAFIQRVYRGWLGRCAFKRRARMIWASQIIQRAWRGYLGRKWYFLMRLNIAASVNIQRAFRGHRARVYVKRVKKVRYQAASVIQAMFRRFQARSDAWRRRQYRNSATAIQRVFRGVLGRKKAMAERDKYIFSRSQSQGIEFGRQMLLEHKLHATRLQSDVTLLTQEKVAAEEQIEALLEEISSFEEGVRSLEKEMHQLSKVEAEAAAYMDEESKYELRDQKIKLDREFGEMLGKIGNRKDMLNDLEKKLSTLDKSRQSKEEELRTLERKLVVLLEEQQNELNAIKRKQDVRGAMLAASHEELMRATTSGGQKEGAMVVAGDRSVNTRGESRTGTLGGGGGGGGPSLQEKRQAAQLMQSTETLMKFGFMSMSMTYFSSLNMIKALRTVSAQDTVMAALADVHAQRAVNFGNSPGMAGGSVASGGNDTVGGMSNISKSQFLPDLKPGQMSGQEALKVSAWSVDDVAKWLKTLSLGQYSEAFIDAAVDGEFLYDLNDDDLKNTLGIEHRLHRKKILNCVHRLKIAEVQRDSRLSNLLKYTGNLDAPVIAPDVDETQKFPKNPFKPDGGMGSAGDDDEHQLLIEGPKVSLAELFSIVRHSKLALLKEALDYLPNKNFDRSLIQSQYVVDNGTVYVLGYERLTFHINKTDEFGNTLLALACQNGNLKISKYLLSKGANPNHQNKGGQTPAHFAIAYKFFDLSQFIFENGGDDTIENKYGLTPYDGLSNEEGGGEGDIDNESLSIV